ncbi:MAG: tRNA lysidine(34) synthetase TilS [Chloroflexi bacterium]|nr:tRNA lysidine(34) synthetase TilS [Chloroflexota bacterium]
MTGEGDKVWESVRRDALAHGLLPPAGQPLVVGVSGGADSLSLLHILRRLEPEGGFRLHVGHLEHGLRGEESLADAAFVQQTCRQWGLPVTVEQLDVAAWAKQERLSLEEAAREARYAFLGGLAASLGGAVVAVAHNADDQAETVLMHWLRGAGLAGLRGMRPDAEMPGCRRPGAWARRWPTPGPLRLVRPLLGVPRAAVEAYCRAWDLQPRLDRTNLERDYHRNRLRHELLPCLEGYNPRLREALCRSAAVFADDYAYLQGQALAVWPDVVRGEGSEEVAFHLSRWRALPPSLQRETLRLAIQRLQGDLRHFHWAHIQRAVEALAGKPTGTVVPLARGLALAIGYDSFRIGRAQPGPPGFVGEQELPLEGEVTLAGSGWTLRACPLSTEAPMDLLQRHRGDRWTALLDLERLRLPLTARARRAGDRFCPQGMGGHSVLLREYLINVKLPRAQRSRWPLVCSGDRVAWVVGWRVDERLALTPQTRRVMLLQVVNHDTARP